MDMSFRWRFSFIILTFLISRGIQNGPGTGKLVSEILMEGKAKSAKLGKLDPKFAL